MIKDLITNGVVFTFKRRKDGVYLSAYKDDSVFIIFGITGLYDTVKEAKAAIAAWSAKNV